MKHLIFTVLSLLSLQQYAQQLLTESEIEEKKFGNESIHFLKSNNTRLNGAYKIGNNQGEYYEATFVDGIANGLVKFYNRYGKLKTEATFEKGIFHGPYRQYAPYSGEMYREYNYKNGELDGKFREYSDGKLVVDRNYKDGKQWSAVTRRRSGLVQTDVEYYKNGEPTGKWVSKLSDGTLREEREYKANGTSVRKEYYDTGRLSKMVHYKGEKYQGDYQLYNSDGILIEEGTYDNDFPTMKKTYYPNGKLKTESYYQNNEQHGKYASYDERGRLLVEGAYLKGYPDGTWKSYTTDGVLTKEAHYDKGREEGAYKEYYPSGILSIEGQYARGQREGVWKYYNEQGQVAKEVKYQNGNSVQVTNYMDK